MDLELRQLQRNAYTDSTPKAWQKYCRALERLQGLSPDDSPEIEGSPLDNFIAKAAKEQSLSKERSKILIERMINYEIDHLDLVASEALREKLDAIPFRSTLDDSSQAYRIRLIQDEDSESYSLVAISKGYHKTEYTFDSGEVGVSKRFYCILEALFKEAV